MELGQGDRWRSQCLGSSSWMPYAAQGVKGTDDDNLSKSSPSPRCRKALN